MSPKRGQKLDRLVLAASLALAGLGVGPGCGSEGGDPAAAPDAGSSGNTSSGASGSASSSSSSSSTSSSSGSSGVDAAPTQAIKNVFVIVMENTSWSTLKGSNNAPYINSLVSVGAHAEQYFTPPGLHPSEPNYIWMEAGDNLGIDSDDDPDKNHRPDKDHLTTQLETAKISWKTYAQGADGSKCPLESSGFTGKYAVKHIPQLYFDDVTDTNSPTSKRCIEHVRPLGELDGDLADPNKTPRYTFIVPDLCNDMHGANNLECPVISNGANIKKGDDFLKDLVPKLQASQAYKNGGVIFIAWDEGDENFPSDASDGPIPFIALGNMVKKGYIMNTKVDHSSFFRTLQTIFGVPYLRGAKTAKDFAEMFTAYP